VNIQHNYTTINRLVTSALLAVKALALAGLAYQYSWLAIALLAVVILLDFCFIGCGLNNYPAGFRFCQRSLRLLRSASIQGMPEVGIFLLEHTQSLFVAVRKLALRIEMFACSPTVQSVVSTQCDIMGEITKFILMAVALREPKNVKANLIFRSAYPIHKPRWQLTFAFS